MRIEKLEYYSSSRDGYTFERHPNIDDITDKINEIIDKLNERDDVVPVIRCKDCEYYNGDEKYCVNDIFAKPNGYCMYGEEKDE